MPPKVPVEAIPLYGDKDNPALGNGKSSDTYYSAPIFPEKL
ncbi:hypothetical protein HMPREF0044_0203 [Gleimia coleocanis DSM 15436]|uniref:Uncharacterized protein n=1 Tax=Gleimia coleocanis DSM 15436 TaxID=525245 RepID=C0VYG3_9ACTO|nr:hypothetical protein HMPREF0044_0203 [Gleimia coleocanis DSM 15436]